VSEIAERQLVNRLWNFQYFAMRAPGSGSVDRPSPDVYAVRDKPYLIEVKKSQDGTAYFEKGEIAELMECARRAQGVAHVVVKPDLRTHDSWLVQPAHKLHETKNGYSIRKKDREQCWSLDEMYNPNHE